ncbi:MAG: inositol monophosphatase, partial [Chloroflexi bacterium]|nr:inositol monophosphatase [Chloroflexota bacterium]
RQAVTLKGEIDLVTAYDHRAEALIVETIRARYPHHAVVAEEGRGAGGTPEHCWYVDPLDGTTNFAHGYPVFAVSIAYERAGDLECAVTYDPTRKECFVAQRGRGAWLNGRRLAVAPATPLDQGLLATGFPYDRANYPLALRRWERLIRAARAVRRAGSAALDLAYVAAGRFDGFWEDWLGPWDLAAGLLLVREAGGAVTDLQGGPAGPRRGQVLATSGHIHAAMLAVLAEAQAGP